MESLISDFCRSLAAFCHHVDTASRSLSDSINRRPIPLDSAASAFLQSIDRRISSAGADLELLESMAFGTVSFEELLGHCNEVFKNNHRCISDLEDRMRSFGYVPEVDSEEEADEKIAGDLAFMSPVSGLHKPPFEFGSVSVSRSCRKILEEDSLFDDSISLQNLGLSDACLATLASEGDDNANDGSSSVMNKLPGSTMSSYNGKASEGATTSGHPKHSLNAPAACNDDVLVLTNAAKVTVKVSVDDYNSLPAFMKSLVSFEELEDAVVKINSFLSEKNGKKQSGAFNQDDLETMGFGRKGRSFVLLLLRINQLVAITTDNSVTYRVHVNCS